MRGFYHLESSTTSSRIRNMCDLKNILPSKLFEVVERAGISTANQIILLSVWDIKKLTNLRKVDITLLKNLVVESVSPQSFRCDKINIEEKNHGRVRIGCAKIDSMLRGGLRSGTLTEIYGESGTGKTQIAIQAAVHNWQRGSVVICTEDLFPVKRFEQMKRSISDYNPDINYGQKTFVEHVTEAHELLSCVRVRLPKLLEQNNLSLIVVDSVAGPFRSEYTNYIQRADQLRELAMSLISMAQKHNVAVLCINQVTACLDETQDVLPSLGLAWSNMVCTRLCLRKTKETVDVKSVSSSAMENTENYVPIRELSVAFAPDLPNSVARFIISPVGLHSA